MRTLTCITLASLLAACTQTPKPTRTADAERLLGNLRALVDSSLTMFGQANPTTITYLDALQHHDTERSDCSDICGSHPAYHESDFMWYRNPEFARRDLAAMHAAYNRGALIGYCWHIDGQHGDFYLQHNGNTTADSTLVTRIVANPDRNTNPDLDWLLTQIDTLVIPVFNELGCPIIFRPWHEMNGSWFWWGSETCSPDEYISLYRLTVDYLRSNNVLNVLYAWSPDKAFATEYYPGDQYVDIIGFDVYFPGIMDYSRWDIIKPALTEMTNFALAHGKVPALTETGCGLSDDGTFLYPDLYPHFWTDNILGEIVNDPVIGRLAWVMSWYGADWSGRQTTCAYIPYLGNQRPNAEAAADDFRAFVASPRILTEDELPNIYD